MQIGILPVGQIASEVLVELQQGIVKILPNTICSVIKDVLPIPQKAFDRKRNQYNSSIILNELRLVSTKKKRYHRILGVVDVDVRDGRSIDR